MRSTSRVQSKSIPKEGSKMRSRVWLKSANDSVNNGEC